MIKKLLKSSIIFMFFLIPIFGFAQDFPKFPMAFWGKAYLNNQLLPKDTKIHSFCGSNLIDEILVLDDGVYAHSKSMEDKLLVKECDQDIFFKLDDGTSLKYDGYFQEGLTINKDLKFIKIIAPSPARTGGGSSSGGGSGGSSTPTTPTTNTGEVTATPSAGGKTTLTTKDGPTVKIEVPANAIVSDTKFEVKTSTMEEVVSAGTTGSAPQSFVMVGGKVYQLTATGGSGQSITTFSKDVTLSFTYTDEEIEDLDEDSLKVYRWNGTEWVALPSTVNKATNTVSATTSQFSNFALMGEEKTEETVVDTTGMTQDQLRAEIARLIALIATLQAQIAQSQGITSSGACDGVTFSRSLSLGMTGDDVKCLQTILNRSVDTQIAVSGVGSIGNETNYFGGLTRDSVIKFQNKYTSEVLTPIGLTTGTGYVGGKTIAKLNQILGRRLTLNYDR